MKPNRRIVITGGPGSGKSTLIAALADAGHATEPEAGRAVIQRQQAIGGDALPWADRARFAQEMAASDIAAHARHENADGPVFFDRGLPDVVGYLGLCGLRIPVAISSAAEALRYSDPVFVAPFWPEIFVQDAERRQDADEALRTWQFMRATYRTLGYALVDIPKATPGARTAFVLDRLKSASL